MKKLLTFVVMWGLLLGFNSLASAANPADVTDTYRFCAVEFFKGAYDDGPRWALANIPFNKTAAISLFDWQNENGTNNSLTLKVSKQFSSNLDLTFNNEAVWNGDKANLTQDIGIDLRSKYVNLGVVFPLKANKGIEGIVIGPRLQVKDLIVYLTLAKGTEAIYGLSYVGKIARLDAAYDKNSDSWFFRTSKSFDLPFGALIPEIRTKFTETENFYGFGIGFIPKS
mgnify:CR=1 FL=1